MKLNWAVYMVNNKCACKTGGDQPYTYRYIDEFYQFETLNVLHIDRYMVGLLHSYEHIHYLPCKQPNEK